MPVDALTFRAACGHFITGVTIVTMRDAAGAPQGLTANSFASVSLDPPLVLVCIDRRITTHGAMLETEGWMINVLSADQVGLSQRFATADIDKFKGLETVDGPHGAPMIPGAIARLAARPYARYDGGDHDIFVGEVTDVEYHDGSPLIFFKGRYRANRHRQQMRRAVERMTLPPDPTIRPVRASEVGSLGPLLLNAYRGTVDDEGETPEQATAAVEEIAAGENGPLLEEASFVAERDGSIVGASLITHFTPPGQDSPVPLVAQLFVAPPAQRQGVGRRLLMQSIDALAAAGYTELSLGVADGNLRAIRLYEQLGFTQAES
ncbi:MAG: GNAT family N-acetyltransferase [Candidatus Dormibacteria bacterium]